MTAFQPGDVVRLTGEWWSTDRFDESDPIVGDVVTVDDDDHFTADDGGKWFISGTTGPFAASLEADDAPTAPAALSPQAVLDAILDKSIPAPVDGYQMAPLMSRGWPIPVVARKVDGHWQVKSVGGGE